MEIHNKAFVRAFHNFHIKELHGNFRSKLFGKELEVVARFLTETLPAVDMPHASYGGAGKFFHVVSALPGFIQQQIQPGCAVAEGFAHHVAYRAVFFSFIDDGHGLTPRVEHLCDCMSVPPSVRPCRLFPASPAKVAEQPCRLRKATRRKAD